MIKITDLNKVYRSKKRMTSHALKNINLTLPDTGLVFVLGKSGSGKSTLLNLIGGLDGISSGKIVVDGNDLSGFSEEDFCNYRNTHLGFVFQDYHLIDELTVYENISLALELRRIEDKGKVKAALEKVDLQGYENRYPTELSGGERQRVAIARAIVKNPRVILADEPTGNLDTHTSTNIISLLKRLSRECLIMIVSHNVGDASKYADRIIELREGSIVSDKSRNPDFPEGIILDGDALVYPEGSSLRDDDIRLINESFGKNLKLVKKTDKFIAGKTEDRASSKHSIARESLSIGRELVLSGRFLKNKAIYIALSSFMVAIIMVILSLAQTIVSFDSHGVIESEMRKADLKSILLVKQLDDTAKNRLGTSYITSIDEGDAAVAYSNGYEGDIYPVLNYTVPISRANIGMGLGFGSLYGTLDLGETFGTMIVDGEFLARKFGDFSYAASRNTFDPRGVIITDYVADLILSKNKLFKNKTYDHIVEEGVYLNGYSVDTVIVNAIIKTDYRERYEELYNRVYSGELKMDHMLSADSDAAAFMSEIYDKLGYCYTTNPNFVNDVFNDGSAIFVNAYVLKVDKGIWSSNTGAIRCANGNGSKKLSGNWRYTTTAPEIPEGARYLRVTYYSGAERYFAEEDEEYKKGYATLAFDGGEPISEQIMKYNGNTSLNVHGDAYLNQAGRTLSDYIEIPEGAVITDFCSVAVENLSYCTFYDENKCIISCESVGYDEIPQGSMILSYDAYNSIFGTTYSNSNVDEFVPHTATFTRFMRGDVDYEAAMMTETVNIIGVGNINIASEDVFLKLRENTYFEYAMYLDGVDKLGQVLSSLDGTYDNQSSIIDGIYTMTRAVEVFVPIFKLVAVFLCIGVIFILSSFSSKMINDKMHEIGIMKALGTKNRSIVAVFGLQVLLITLLTCIMMTVGYYFFIDLANDVLIDSLKRLAQNRVVLDLDFLVFEPLIALINCVLICILSVISLIFPMIKIKAIKPVKIIKAKE